LGIILYYLLFGRYPFEGSKDSEIYDRIVKEDHVFPNNILLTTSCYKLINGLLAKSPKQRLDMSDPLFEDWFNNPGFDEPVFRKVEKRLSFNPETKMVSESMSPRKLDHRKSTKVLSFTNANKFKPRSNSTILVGAIKSTISKPSIILPKIIK
jgi:serine/threonine protein kinase